MLQKKIKHPKHSRHKMTEKLNNDNGLQTRWTERQLVISRLRVVKERPPIPTTLESVYSGACCPPQRNYPGSFPFVSNLPVLFKTIIGIFPMRQIPISKTVHSYFPKVVYLYLPKTVHSYFLVTSFYQNFKISPFFAFFRRFLCFPIFRACMWEEFR